MPTRFNSGSRSVLLTSLLCCAASVAALGCGSSKGAGTGTAGAGAAGSAGAGITGAAGATMDAATTDAAGSAGAAGSGTAGASGADGGAGRVAFKNYEVTGTWPTQPVAIKQMPGQLKYTKVVIKDQFLAESCSIADYNNDGVPDVSSGRTWYQGPDFQTTHAFRDGHGALPTTGAGPEINTGVSDDSADFPFDLDGDGWTDIVNIASDEIDELTYTEPKFGKVQVHNTAVWYRNPGPALAGDPMWASQLMSSDVRLEQHGLVDMDGDGFPEIFGACKNCTPPMTKGYYHRNPYPTELEWVFQPVTIPYTFPFEGEGKLHGAGAGDINGDGRPDLLERGGAWLQQPDGTWNQTPCTGKNVPAGCGWIKQSFYSGVVDNVGNLGGSHMYAVDMDKDGLTDVVSADWAHGEGLAWYRQGPDFTFTKYQFLGGGGTVRVDGGVAPNPDLATWGAGFSEPHALQVVDMDGDGRADVITGKMRFAQPIGYGDLDPNGPPYLYVFKNVGTPDPRSKGADGSTSPITLQPVQIDPNPGATPGDAGTTAGGMGVGRQIAIGHVNTDGIMDICVATKVGLAVFLGQ